MTFGCFDPDSVIFLPDLLYSRSWKRKYHQNKWKITIKRLVIRWTRQKSWVWISHAFLGDFRLISFYSSNSIPDGILSILSGARETGELLSSHMRIRKISFTGSVPAGKAVAQAAARSNLKPCTLELGGKSPVLVFEDCDLEDTVQKWAFSLPARVLEFYWCASNCRAMGGFTRNSGQLCIAGTRIYVQDTIYETFSNKLAAALENYTVGDPNDPASKAGPQVDSFQVCHFSAWLMLYSH